MASREKRMGRGWLPRSYMRQMVAKEAYGTISMKLHSLHHQPDLIITNTNNSITSTPTSANHTQPTHTFTTAILKSSVATILSLAAAAFATPTPGGGFGGHGGRFGNVYCTDDNDAIIDIDVSVDLRNPIVARLAFSPALTTLLLVTPSNNRGWWKQVYKLIRALYVTL